MSGTSEAGAVVRRVSSARAGVEKTGELNRRMRGGGAGRYCTSVLPMQAVRPCVSPATRDGAPKDGTSWPR